MFPGQMRSFNFPHTSNQSNGIPFTLQDRWHREANRRRVAVEVTPFLADFVNFVNAEAGIATDPVCKCCAQRRVQMANGRESEHHLPLLKMAELDFLALVL